MRAPRLQPGPPRRPPERPKAPSSEASRRGSAPAAASCAPLSTSPSPPARLRSARPRPGPDRPPPPPRGAPARPAAAPHLVLREHWGLRVVGCHVRAHAGPTAPTKLQQPERKRRRRRRCGAGGPLRERAGVQGRAAGRGGTRSAAAREAGGLGWSKRGGTPETRSSSGARVARPAAGARAGARLGRRLVAEARGPRRRRGWGGLGDGGKGRETWLFRRETTLRFCSTTRSPREPAARERRLQIRPLSPNLKPHLKIVHLRLAISLRTREGMRGPKSGGVSASRPATRRSQPCKPA